MKSCSFIFVLWTSLLAVGCKEATRSSDARPPDAPVRETPDHTATQTVSLHVPGMLCPVACWPKVKKTLEAQSSVVSVALAPQANDKLIDNPVVFVTAGDEFDSSRAIAALEEAGFTGASMGESD